MKTVLEIFVAEKEWDDEIELDDESGSHYLVTHIKIMNQVFELEVYGDDQRDRLSLFLTPPFRATEGTNADLCQLFNYLNERYLYSGRLSVDMSGRIKYKAVIDTDNLEPSAAMIDNLLGSAIALFDNQMEPIAAVAMTNRTFAETLADYEKKEAINDARSNQE